MNRKETILLVDDDPHMLHGTARILSNAGYVVIQARSAAEGVQAAGERQPDLILLDVVLPDGDGCEICRQLKNDPLTTDIFIVIVSALKTKTDDQCRGLEIGADDYIVRPIANRELLARVRTMLRLKAAENALREREKMFLNAAFTSVPIVMMLVDSDGRVEKISDSGTALIGRPEADLIGILCGEALNCINARNMLECGRQAHCRACPIRNCIDLTLQTGKALKQVEGKLSVLRDGDQKSLYFLISTALLKLQNESSVLLLLMDVTAQKTAEQRIRDSEQAYKVLFHDSPVALYVQDFAKVEALVKTMKQSGVSRLESYLATHPAEVNRLAGAVRIVEINQAAVDLYKADSRDQFQHDFHQVLNPDDIQHFIDQVVAFTSGQDHYEGPARNYDLQGNTLEILLRKAVINRKANGLSKILASVIDVTELHRAHRENAKLEKRLYLAQKMESIGNLAGGIAHDFNNILFPIMGLSELMLEDLAPGSQEYKNAQEILKAGKRGSDLVRQIMAFSRKSEEKIFPVQLPCIVKEALSLSRSTIPANIEISHDVDNKIGLVQADPIRLHQIIMNLITNAFHAVETDGGAISIRLREIVLDRPDAAGMSLKPGRYAMLSVADTGCGIEDAILSKIFDPYFTTKPQGKGTGLGLAVVYGIVRQYQGDIQVYSEVQKGTCFNIYLPVIDHDDPLEPALPAASLSTGTERVLLVDDEAAVVALEKQMLTRLGYQVMETTRSADALKAFQAHPQSFDLVITDLSMPNMTGDQLAGAILSIRPDMPIIICTGFSEKIVQSKFSRIGIKGVLMKPIAMADLAGIVRNVLDAVTTGQTELQG